MANNELKNNTNAPVSNMMDTGLKGILFIAGTFILGGIMYKSGYDTGIGVANKVLRRHDKDARRMSKEAAKREKQLRKELTPETEKKWKWPWQ